KMLVSRRFHPRDPNRACTIENLTIRSALIIGLIQCIAMWPGTSRSMVTILAGLAMGLNLVAAAEFSFLLALPTLSAATVYKMLTQWDALTSYVGLDALIAGIAISTVVAALSVKFFIRHLTRFGLAPFGIYRIALAIGIVLYFANPG
ncbi:MAG: undecaprenyl-diphosphatase, partial [Kiritimatiellaceae bacterium]|nr:undecaprenyl-diphosphatase [Kiritimatiellaceae bacterium]